MRQKQRHEGIPEREGVERFGVSVGKRLLRQFDAFAARKKYRNRSEALRDLMRAARVEEAWDTSEGEVVGMITLLYDHHTRLLQSKLTEIQHDQHLKIISSMHVHLDHHNCLEVMIVRGRANEIRSLASRLISIKGVKHGKVVAASASKSLA